MNDISLLNRINNIDETKLQRFCFFILSAWIVFPLIVMILNLLSVNGIYVYTFWMYALYIVGMLGLMVGFIYFIGQYSNSYKKNGNMVSDYKPVVLLGAFLVWSLLSCSFASDKMMSFFGVLPMTSSWFTFLFFGGFLFAAIICAKDSKLIVSLAKLFVLVSLVQAVITIFDNSFSFKANIVEPFTNCDHYQSVFYNTNHYAYYLLITIVVVFFLTAFTKQLAKRTIYTILFALFVMLLILNNTFGAYLSLAITIAVVLLYSWIRKTDEKTVVLFLSLVFILTSLLSLAFTPNLKESILSFFADTGTIVTDQEIGDVGSGRGALWKSAMESIKRNPILGYGFENKGAVEPERFDNGEQYFVTQPHNFLLFFAKSTGIPGLCLYLAALFLCAIEMVKRWSSLSPEAKASFFVVMSYLMSAFFGVVKFYTSPYYVMLLGICISSLRCNKGSRQVLTP